MFFKDLWRTMIRHRGQGQQHYIDGPRKVPWLNYFFSASVKSLSVAPSVSFLVSLNFATLEDSFDLSSLSLCFFLRWPCIAASPGCQAENCGGGGPLRLLPSPAELLSDCDMILKTRCELYKCLHEQNKLLVSHIIRIYWSSQQSLFLLVSLGIILLDNTGRGRVYKLKFCLFVLLSVRHHFNISNLGPSNHRRIMLGPTHCASLERCQWWQLQWQRPHKGKDKDKDKHKDNDKMLTRPSICYIFKK